MTKETKAEMESSRARLVQDYRRALQRIGDLENERNLHEARLRWLAENVSGSRIEMFASRENNQTCIKCVRQDSFEVFKTVIGTAVATPLEGLTAAIDKARGK